MRKWIGGVAAAFVSLISFQAAAANTAFVCLFKPSGERFNIVTIEGFDYIQWGSGKFEGIVSKFNPPYLVITQYGYKGTFRMVYDVPKGVGYGGIEAFDGQKFEGEILCATQ